MKQPKPPLWERDPERYADKAKARIRKLSVVDPETGCWAWTGSVRGVLGHDGAGRSNSEDRARPQVRHAGRMATAYRVAYELWVGPIPEGLGIDHTCENRLCVNPRHLDPVTTQENSRRYWERRRTKRKRALVDTGHPGLQSAGSL